MPVRDLAFIPEGKQVLLVHDAAARDLIIPVLRSLGLQVTAVSDLSIAAELAAREEFEIALVAVARVGDEPGSLLSRLREALPSVVVLAERHELPRAMQVLREGADDYLLLPPDRSEVQARIGRILMWQELDDRLGRMQRELGSKYLLGNVVARSEGMRRVRDQILQVAGARSTVLILGESGVGKELVAKAIHFNSPRRSAPFIAINCSAIPATLIESELFGHERGAFTGAVGRQKGKFELAHGGTLFLDEIGEMDLATQAKLLRVLEEREFMRVGGGREVRVDVRLLAATNTDLEALIARGRFREDLYFRLKVITVRVPPLRERTEDIPALARAFLEQICRDNGLHTKRLTGKAVRALQRYHWPGNARELKNVLESGAITRPGRVLRAADLTVPLRAAAAIEAPAGPAEPARAVPLRETEREAIRGALLRHDGNRTHAARALQIGIRTLQRKIRAYRIVVPGRRGRRPGAPQRSTVVPSPGAS